MEKTGPHKISYEVADMTVVTDYYALLGSEGTHVQIADWVYQSDRHPPVGPFRTVDFGKFFDALVPCSASELEEAKIQVVIKYLVDKTLEQIPEDTVRPYNKEEVNEEVLDKIVKTVFHVQK